MSRNLRSPFCIFSASVAAFYFRFSSKLYIYSITLRTIAVYEPTDVKTEPGSQPERQELEPPDILFGCRAGTWMFPQIGIRVVLIFASAGNLNPEPGPELKRCGTIFPKAGAGIGAVEEFYSEPKSESESIYFSESRS